MIRVFMIDDHPLMRTGMRWVLEEAGDIEVVGEAANGRDALASIPTVPIDLVVCDFDLPDTDGLDLTRRLLRQDPDRKVLIVSMLERSPIPRRLLAAGALGYVSKTSDPLVVLRAVREVAAGRRFLDNALACQVLFDSSPFDQLSPRELEVAMLMVKGESIRRIADSLRVTESTVRTIRSRVFDKLDVRGDASLVYLAVEHGLA